MSILSQVVKRAPAKKLLLLLLCSLTEGLSEAIAGVDAKSYPAFADYRDALVAAVGAEKRASGTLRDYIKKGFESCDSRSQLEWMAQTIWWLLDGLESTLNQNQGPML